MGAITIGSEIHFNTNYDVTKNGIPYSGSIAPNYALLAHETVHSVQQYRETLTLFVPDYLQESFRSGYENGRHEVEAYAMQSAVNRMIQTYPSNVFQQILAGNPPSSLSTDLLQWYNSAKAALEKNRVPWVPFM
ncbi:MAG: hypothetical protein U0892_02895 [Pirellulales bacterium]